MFPHFPRVFLVFPSLQHLAAVTSAILRPRPHQSAQIEWPSEASASTQLLGWHHDIMISWATRRFHLNRCCQILWAYFLNRISLHLNMTPADKLERCLDSSKARENHVASLICPELLNQKYQQALKESKYRHMLNNKLANPVLRPEQQRRGFQDRHRTMAACLLDLHS